MTTQLIPPATSGALFEAMRPLEVGSKIHRDEANRLISAMVFEFHRLNTSEADRLIFAILSDLKQK